MAVRYGSLIIPCFMIDHGRQACTPASAGAHTACHKNRRPMSGDLFGFTLDHSRLWLCRHRDLSRLEFFRNAPLQLDVE